MTAKELRKLKRSDFLQLLLTQGKDMSAVQARLDETAEELEQTKATVERLIAKLDEKDELIEKLKGRLDNKDATISELQQEIEDTKANRKIELEQAGSIAMAALSLNEIFEVAQKAADQYLYNIHLMHNELERKCLAQREAQKHLEEALQIAKSAFQTEEAPIVKPEEPALPEQKISFFEKLRGH